MEPFEDTIKLYYNTEREKMAMPEYGRNVLRMVEIMKAEPDRAVRSTMARAIVGVMETLNPSVRQQDNYSHKLWDHLYIIAGYDLDIDSPYPAPVKEDRESKPMTIPLKKKPVKATHYGRNIESIIDLIALEPEGETRTSMIRALATYMRQQYLIWNKDSVADETIFSDIEKLSDGRIKVPEGISLSKISSDANFARPGMGVNVGQPGKNRNSRKYNHKGRKR